MRGKRCGYWPQGGRVVSTDQALLPDSLRCTTSGLSLSYLFRLRWSQGHLSVSKLRLGESFLQLPQEPKVSIADSVAEFVCPTEDCVLYQIRDRLEFTGRKGEPPSREGVMCTCGMKALADVVCAIREQSLGLLFWQYFLGWQSGA